MKRLSIPMPMNIIWGCWIKISKCIGWVREISDRSSLKVIRRIRNPFNWIWLLNIFKCQCQSNTQDCTPIKDSQARPNKVWIMESDSNNCDKHSESKANSFSSHDKLRISIKLMPCNLAFFKKSHRKTRRFLHTSNCIKPKIPENSCQHMRKQHQKWLTCSNQSYCCQSNIPLSHFSIRSLFFHAVQLLTFNSSMKCLTNLARTDKIKEKTTYMWLFCQHNLSKLIGVQ